jgi:hypothetical protein
MIKWALLREAECRAANRPGAANHHYAKVSALRAVLEEVDRLTRPCRTCDRQEVVCVCGESR